MQATSAQPIHINNVTFRCYHVVGLRFKWVSDDTELEAYRYPPSLTYRAVVREELIQKKFRSMQGAMRYAVEVRQSYDVWKER